jgi:hypothetical protein
VIMAFGQTFGATLGSWGDAPGYGGVWPSANRGERRLAIAVGQE